MTDGYPDFVVIGAQKSASTFLQDQLHQHPDVEIAEGEVRFFEDPFYSEEAVRSLPALFTGGPERVRGIKRPDYLGHEEVPERLRHYLPDAKLFAVVRDPVARAVSAYYHYVRHGFVPLMPIDEAFTALLQDRLAASHPRSVEVLSYGRYGHHLAHWLEFFPREQLMVFDQESLTKDPATSLQRAFAFVGVDPAFVPRRAPVSNKGVYSYPRLRLLRTKNRFVYDYTPRLEHRYPKRPSPLGWAYNAAVVAVDRKVLSHFDDGRPPKLSPELKAQVAAYYAPDRAALQDVLGDSPVKVGWL